MRSDMFSRRMKNLMVTFTFVITFLVANAAVADSAGGAGDLLTYLYLT